MTPLTHEQTSELLGRYARSELDARTAADVRRHLQTCPGCRSELAGLRRLISSPLPPGEASELSATERERLRATVMDAVRQQRTEGRPSLSRRDRGRAVRWLGAAAVLLVLAVAASGVGLNGGGGGSGSAGSGGGQFEQAVPGPRRATRLPAALAPRFDRHAGQVSKATLSRLATARPTGGADAGGNTGVAQAIRAVRGMAPGAALGVESTLLNRLARAAPARTAAQVRRCGGRVVARPGATLALYGARASFHGRPALVLGFARPGRQRAADRYIFWVFAPGRCDRIGNVSGALPP